ncbi:MAG: helix-turn-helix domain-containing protein [Xanthomonadales bacterium]|nr:helix-turn-helix domain-containing protein [Xanthomonadales bacterium]
MDKKKIVDVDEDKFGFIWIATDEGLYRFDSLKTVSITEMVDFPTDLLVGVIDISVDPSNNLWIVTKNDLFVFDHKKIVSPDWAKELEIKKIFHINDSSYFLTPLSVIELTQNRINHYEFPTTNKPKFIKNFSIDKNNNVYIASKEALFSFNPINKQIESILYTPDLSKPFIWDVHVDSENIVWVSTDTGVYRRLNSKETWEAFAPEKLPKIIKSINSTDEDIWLASAIEGLVQFNRSEEKITIHQKNQQPMSLQSNTLTNVFIDTNQYLWVSSFDGQLLMTNPNLTSLNWQDDCTKKEDVFAFKNFQNNVYMALLSGIAVYSDQSVCSIIKTQKTNKDPSNDFIPTSFYVANDNTFWVGSSMGLHVLDPTDLEITNIYSDNKIDSVNFISEIDDQTLVYGTSTGLFYFDINNKKTTQITNEKNQQVYFFDYVDHGSVFYFATNYGVYSLQKRMDQKLKQLKDTQMMSIESIVNFEDKLIWSTDSGGLFIYDLSKSKLQTLGDFEQPYLNISNLIVDQAQNIWFTSNQGLTQYKQQSNSIININEHLGLTSKNFTLNSAYSQDNWLLIGTRSGAIKVNIDNNLINTTLGAPVVLTGLSSFNQKILIGQQKNSILHKDINQIDQLLLTHRELAVTFEFSRLNYNDPFNETYRYQLAGFDPDWIETDYQNPQATYTNLPSGQYEFMVQSINTRFNKDNTAVKTLAIKVLPPPWLSWWAITAYVLLGLLLIYFYIQHKIKTNQLLTERLRVEVAEKTKELNIQKQTVESLLEKKNELFSNVSHEFRTPLTLILGPLKELLSKQNDRQDVKSLSMINRNANRLLSLVEQLLQIARVSDLDKVKTKPQKTYKQVSSLVESFEHLAQNKRIKLNLQANETATIDVTEQFIDAVLGNLLSNAIKYTQAGGSVWVSATTNDDSFLLSVKDTGTGLTNEQQKDIFKRFKRLESHQAIEGIGIGLSVVEEVVKVNHGTISVTSELGFGSEFIVRIPLSEALESQEDVSISTLVNQLQNESRESHSIVEVSQEEPTSGKEVFNNTVLIIEDNNDMRQHIVDIVSPHYNCLTAVNGVKGVAIAIEEVPDIIISDVMMPEMDGFKVARIIRSDQRTSHIPLMLLTALNDKTSRIKGWRENVDAYMTKPFDRDELLVQLENMLTIRDILKHKAGQEHASGKHSGSTLPKKDQEFVDKLMLVIKENYMDPILNRPKIASKLAVSDRQLQRKIKALIDLNPMDMLREFRLNKAKEMLRDGYQVSQVADDCGFNSLSYFSQCFKAQFGMSPKKFQNTA